MLKTLLISFFLLFVTACAKQETLVIDLKKEQIEQKSYAIGYATVTQSYKGIVKPNYDIHSFTSGVKDFYTQRFTASIPELKEDLYTKGKIFDANVFNYYSGVIFASELKDNFDKLGCWSVIKKPSLTQGIYDAMKNLQKMVTHQDDPYINQGVEKLLQSCHK